jgi:hypothetical protein
MREVVQWRRSVIRAALGALLGMGNVSFWGTVSLGIFVSESFFWGCAAGRAGYGSAKLWRGTVWSE